MPAVRHMEVKPTKGLKVSVDATREALFEEEGVDIKRISPFKGKSSLGVLTGRTLVGYCEVEMSDLDGKKHWYPIDQILAENGDALKEEEILIPTGENSDGEADEDGEVEE